MRVFENHTLVAVRSSAMSRGCGGTETRGHGERARGFTALKTVTMILAGCLALTWPAFGQSTQPREQGRSAPRSLSHVAQAQGLVKTTCDPDILQLDPETLQVLLASPGVLRTAWRETYAGFEESALDPDAQGVAVDFVRLGAVGQATSRPAGRYAQPTPRSDTIVGCIVVDTAGNPGAVELLSHICSRLQVALEQTYKAKLDELNALYKNAKEELERADLNLREYGETRKHSRQTYEVSDPSPEALIARSNDLEKEKLRLEMELAGQNARQKSIQMQIAAIGARATASAPESDPMIQAMRARVELLKTKQRHLQKMVEQGLSSIEEQSQQAAALAMAEAELAMQIRKAAGGETLSRLNDELVDISIDTAQKQAELEQIREQLERIRWTLERVDRDAGRKSVDQALAQETYRSARMRMYEIDQMRHRLRAPVVTLIGDTDGER